VEPQIIVAAPPEHDDESAVDSIFLGTPTDIVEVEARMSLPDSDEAMQSGIQAHGYVSRLEVVSGPKPTLIVYIDLSEA
jgi:hypothetical protein